MAEMAFREPNEVLWRGVRPAHKGTQVQNSALANNALVIVRTATAGKTLYITYFYFSWRFTATGQTGFIGIRNGADVFQSALFYISSNAGDQGGVAASFLFPVEVPAGWDVYVGSDTAGALAYGGIVGWEE